VPGNPHVRVGLEHREANAKSIKELRGDVLKYSYGSTWSPGEKCYKYPRQFIQRYPFPEVLQSAAYPRAFNEAVVCCVSLASGNDD